MGMTMGQVMAAGNSYAKRTGESDFVTHVPLVDFERLVADYNALRMYSGEQALQSDAREIEFNTDRCQVVVRPDLQPRGATEYRDDHAESASLAETVAQVLNLVSHIKRLAGTDQEWCKQIVRAATQSSEAGA